MKIVLTESQIKYVINEVSTDEAMMDYLLDKLSNVGMEGLTPKEQISLRRLSGEDVGDEETNDVPVAEPEVHDESNDIDYIKQKFFDYFPSNPYVRVNGMDWRTFLETSEDSYNDGVIVSVQEDKHILIYPFVNGTRTFKVTPSFGKGFTYNYKDKLPETDIDIKNFVLVFLRLLMPKIIKHSLTE